jgi:hypothetical protein
VTKLLVETLVTGATMSQEIRFDRVDRYNIASIAPYLYISNFPGGTFTLTLSNLSGDLFSKSFTSDDIRTSLNTVNNFAHVFYPVIPQNLLILESGTYTLKLTSDSYYNTSSSYIGWIRQHEDLNNILDYEALSDDKNPLATRIKTLDKGIK